MGVAWAGIDPGTDPGGTNRYVFRRKRVSFRSGGSTHSGLEKNALRSVESLRTGAAEPIEAPRDGGGPRGSAFAGSLSRPGGILAETLSEGLPFRPSAGAGQRSDETRGSPWQDASSWWMATPGSGRPFRRPWKTSASASRWRSPPRPLHPGGAGNRLPRRDRRHGPRVPRQDPPSPGGPRSVSRGRGAPRGRGGRNLDHDRILRLEAGWKGPSRGRSTPTGQRRRRPLRAGTGHLTRTGSRSAAPPKRPAGWAPGPPPGSPAPGSRWPPPG